MRDAQLDIISDAVNAVDDEINALRTRRSELEQRVARLTAEVVLLKQRLNHDADHILDNDGNIVATILRPDEEGPT